MSEKYTSMIKKSHKKSKESRLIIKNGLVYIISIVKDQKPKFKKPKFFKDKKWIIKNVLLHSIEIIDKEEIAKIINLKATEQQAYDKAFQMTNDCLYSLFLSNNQYKVLCRFLEAFNIEIGNKISLRRIGKGFSTRITFMKTTGKSKK